MADTLRPIPFHPNLTSIPSTARFYRLHASEPASASRPSLTAVQSRQNSDARADFALEGIDVASSRSVSEVESTHERQAREDSGFILVRLREVKLFAFALVLLAHMFRVACITRYEGS
jgi:hypothetical protein